jgi:putative transposase
MRKSPKQIKRRNQRKDEFQQAIGLTDKEVLSVAGSAVGDHLALSLEGKQYQSALVWHLLLWASAKRTSVEDACEQLASSPSPNTVRNYLSEDLLKEVEALEDQLNATAKSKLPPQVIGHRHKVAIDLVFIPYHGQAHKDSNEIRRSAAKSGTTHFHCYASAYIIKRNKRLTLAFTYVRGNDTLIDVLSRLFRRLEDLGIGFLRLLLDKGFYTVAVIRFLQERRLPFVIPVIHRGRSGGSRTVCQGKRSYQTSYTMSNQEVSVTFDVRRTRSVRAIRKYTKGRYKRKGVVWFVYAINQWSGAISGVYEEYRLREG